MIYDYSHETCDVNDQYRYTDLINHHHQLVLPIAVFMRLIHQIKFINRQLNNENIIQGIELKITISQRVRKRQMRISTSIIGEQYLHMYVYVPPSTACQIILQISLYYSVTIGMLFAEGDRGPPMKLRDHTECA